MAFELNKIAEQSRELWQKLPPRRRWGFLAAGIGTLVLVGALATRAPTENHAVLFSGLAADDAGRVVEYLRAQNVPYKVESGGTVVTVPAAKVHELRITMASSGLPKGAGVGFELFDKQAFGTTSFVEQMNYRRALQGELSRTIMSVDSVEKARVHIAMRERSLFREEDDPPSASVVLALRPGRKLTPAQVRGVVHLVASSVEGLQAERVTVIDETGAALWSGDDATAGVETQRELERTLSRRVTEIVDRMVGAGHSEVVVTAELDHSRTERMEEFFEKDKVALRSEARTEEKSNSGEAAMGGVAGARGNLPGAPSPGAEAAEGGSSASKSSETRNYEVPRIVNKTVGPKVQLKKLHVAVLVDEPIGEGGKPTPRTKGELDRIASLAREAAGLDADRGDKLEVHAAPFVLPKTETAEEAAARARAALPWPLNQPKKTQIIVAAIAGGLFLVAAIVTMVVTRRRRNSRQAPPAELPLLPLTVGELEAALPEAAHHMPMTPSLPAAITARDRALEAARTDSTRAARIVGAWLAEQPVEARQMEGYRS